MQQFSQRKKNDLKMAAILCLPQCVIRYWIDERDREISRHLEFLFLFFGNMMLWWARSDLSNVIYR